MVRPTTDRGRWGGRLRLPLAALCVLPALAQSDAAGPAFEVASVKVSAPLAPGVMQFRMGGGPDSSDPGRITYQGVTLKVLAARAYDVKDYQVQAPAWMENERYDVMATIPKGVSKDQLGPMLQRLLAERFHLTVHHETKPMAVYTLSVAKGGAKLEEVDPATLPAPPPAGSAPPPPPPSGSGASKLQNLPAGTMRMEFGANTRTIMGNISIERLCTMLGNLTDRPVIDLTGLKGTYALHLTWTPDENEKMGGKVGQAMALHGGGDPPAAAANGTAPASASDPGPTLAQALENTYGLKLEARKNPADIIVIDHADKVPTEN